MPPMTVAVLGGGAWGTAFAIHLATRTRARPRVTLYVRSAEQAMPVLVVTVMAQLVLCGGMVPVTDRVVLSQLSWLAPSRWGYSAGAATLDLTGTGTGLPADPLWIHAAHSWLRAVAALGLNAAVLVYLLSNRMRRMRQE